MTKTAQSRILCCIATLALLLEAAAAFQPPKRYQPPNTVHAPTLSGGYSKAKPNHATTATATIPPLPAPPSSASAERLLDTSSSNDDVESPDDVSSAALHHATMSSGSGPSTVALPAPLPDLINDQETMGVNVEKAKSRDAAWGTMKQRIRRRLNTHEDYLGIHKVSAITWFLASVGIAGVGVSTGFKDVPHILEIPTWIALVSSVTQAFTGYDMALKYRAHDPIVKRGMVNGCFGMITTALAALYIGPFAPAAFNDYQIGNGLVVMTVAPTLLLAVDEVMNFNEKMKHRHLRSKEPGKNNDSFEELADLTSYGLAIVTPALGAVIAMVFACNPAHDRLWILKAAANGEFNTPHFLAENYFSAILFNLSIGIGMFAITLRDKKMITKDMEQTLVALFTLPATVLAIHSLPF